MNWSNYTEIANMLVKHYPNSPVTVPELSDDDLIKMVISLPDFKGDKNDPDVGKHIIYVRNVWISTLFPKTSYNTQAGLDYHYDE